MEYTCHVSTNTQYLGTGRKQHILQNRTNIAGTFTTYNVYHQILHGNTYYCQKTMQTGVSLRGKAIAQCWISQWHKSQSHISFYKRRLPQNQHTKSRSHTWSWQSPPHKQCTNYTKTGLVHLLQAGVESFSWVVVQKLDGKPLEGVAIRYSMADGILELLVANSTHSQAAFRLIG